MCVVAGCEGIDCVCVKSEMGYVILIEKYEEECVCAEWESFFTEIKLTF